MTVSNELLISADSHVVEDSELWASKLPASLREKMPVYKKANVQLAQYHNGGQDPALRVKEMAQDGVSVEILYPSLALEHFGLPDAALQEASFQIYNEWLLEYCSVAPDRLLGLACISTYRMDQGIKLLESWKKTGMRGALIWQTPPTEYSFGTRYHDPFWEAAQALDMPISLHIHTGATATGIVPKKRSPLEFLNFAVTEKLENMNRSLVNLIGSGVFDRFPKLKIILVETEVSWLPFFISQMDKYAGKKYQDLGYGTGLKSKPSEYFGRNIFATFFNDPPIAALIERWGADSWMWSNDFPHPNSTWPNSREVIGRDLSAVSPQVRSKLTQGNAARVYGMGRVPALAS